MGNRLSHLLVGENSTRRIVSILSGKGGVGKSVLSVGLAEQLALMGRRVLLVDADHGCGNLHAV